MERICQRCGLKSSSGTTLYPQGSFICYKCKPIGYSLEDIEKKLKEEKCLTFKR